MVFPVVHLGGTSRQTLIEEYNAAMATIDAAIEAIRAITVNRRDYLIGGSFDDAVREHDARIAVIETVRTELLDICLDLYDAD